MRKTAYARMIITTPATICFDSASTFRRADFSFFMSVSITMMCGGFGNVLAFGPESEVLFTVSCEMPPRAIIREACATDHRKRQRHRQHLHATEASQSTCGLYTCVVHASHAAHAVLAELEALTAQSRWVSLHRCRAHVLLVERDANAPAAPRLICPTEQTVPMIVVTRRIFCCISLCLPAAEMTASRDGIAKMMDEMVVSI
eukprot:359493-Pleurochrysis_carterae.AAC.1